MGGTQEIVLKWTSDLFRLTSFFSFCFLILFKYWPKSGCLPWHFCAWASEHCRKKSQRKKRWIATTALPWFPVFRALTACLGGHFTDFCPSVSFFMTIIRELPVSGFLCHYYPTALSRVTHLLFHKEKREAVISVKKQLIFIEWWIGDRQCARRFTQAVSLRSLSSSVRRAESQSPRGESCRTAEWLATQRYLANVEAGSRRWVARHLRQQYECSVHIPQNPLVLQYQVANHRVGERKTHDEKSST